MQNAQTINARMEAEAEELLDAIDVAERTIVSTIERECQALRGGHLLAARALHTRLCDAASLYLDATRAARASIRSLEHIIPGCLALLEERRASFSSFLKVELAALATQRAAAGRAHEPDFAGQTLGSTAAPALFPEAAVGPHSSGASRVAPSRAADRPPLARRAG